MQKLRAIKQIKRSRDLHERFKLKVEYNLFEVERNFFGRAQPSTLTFTREIFGTTRDES